ncbi:mCG147165 [Mus musculus]|nr:mCG147165 [Mus musculus]
MTGGSCFTCTNTLSPSVIISSHQPSQGREGLSSRSFHLVS